MKKISIAFLVYFFIMSCMKVPVTNRRQLHLLPEVMMTSMSVTSYKDFLQKNTLQTANDGNTQMVKNVGTKIASAVETYMRQKGLSKRIKGYKWEFNLVKDNQVNAWCMPGGKVVVYTGLLPVTQDEASLAAVMGHEIAHAIARHGNERMSQGLAAQMGGAALSVVLADKPQETQALFMQSYGVASQLGLLKYSRTHESEADKMGLIFMAMAGYNPQSAVGFWERMAKQGGSKSLEILSTHPSDETRIKDIKAFMPKALSYYKTK